MGMLKYQLSVKIFSDFSGINKNFSSFLRCLLILEIVSLINFSVDSSNFD